MTPASRPPVWSSLCFQILPTFLVFSVGEEIRHLWGAPGSIQMCSVDLLRSTCSVWGTSQHPVNENESDLIISQLSCTWDVSQPVIKWQVWKSEFKLNFSQYKLFKCGSSEAVNVCGPSDQSRNSFSGSNCLKCFLRNETRSLNNGFEMWVYDVHEGWRHVSNQKKKKEYENHFDVSAASVRSSGSSALCFSNCSSAPDRSRKAVWSLLTLVSMISGEEWFHSLWFPSMEK